MHCKPCCREAAQHTVGHLRPAQPDLLCCMHTHSCIWVRQGLAVGKYRRKRTHLETCRHARHVANLLQAQALGTQHASRQGQVAPHLHASCSWGYGPYNCQCLAIPVAIAWPNKCCRCCCYRTGGLLRVAPNLPRRRICGIAEQQAHQGVVLEVMLLPASVTPSPGWQKHHNSCCFKSPQV